MIAAILGGGPSLPEQLEHVPEDAVLFGINWHASRLVECDYIVFNDADTWETVKHLPGLKISQWRDRCDIHWESPAGQVSGVCALKYALSQDFDEILLAGFDCYRGERYFYDSGRCPKNTDIPLEEHLRRWPYDPRVKAIGGPLMQVYQDRPEEIEPELDEVEITEAKTVVLDKNTHVNFVPGVQRLRPELIEAAREAGILK